jgi:hypothetical protein
MWRVLTQNVDLVPSLSLEQWETVFRIVSFGAAASSFAAFKSFEVGDFFNSIIAIFN